MARFFSLCLLIAALFCLPLTGCQTKVQGQADVAAGVYSR